MICIGIALVFWLLVKMSQTYTTSRRVNFQFAIPEAKALAEAPPDDFTVRIRGAGWDLLFSYFANREITVFYDLTDSNMIERNQNQLRSDISQQLSSNDLQIAEINYERLSFPLEEKVSKKVPVILQRSLSFALEYQLESQVELEPDSVLVTGPVSEIEEISRWLTDSLVLADIRASQTRQVPLRQPPSIIDLGVSRVKVHIPVEQYTEKSLFVPLEIQNAPPNDSLRFFPQRVNVTFVVGLSKYNLISPDDFRLVADLEGLPIDQRRNQVPIQLVGKPEGVRNVQFSPRAAEFFIFEREETSSR